MKRSLVFLACLILIVPGCTPKTVKVTGKLVKNGQVQTFAEDLYVTLQFVPLDPQAGRKSYSATLNRPQGTYDVQLPAGKYRVSLFVPPTNSDMSKPEFVPPPVGAAENGPEYEFTKDTVQDINIP